jgi:hypothetical protein
MRRAASSRGGVEPVRTNGRALRAADQRHRAVHVLGEIPVAGALTIQTLEDAHPSVRRSAKEAMRRITHAT